MVTLLADGLRRHVRARRRARILSELEALCATRGFGDRIEVYVEGCWARGPAACDCPIELRSLRRAPASEVHAPMMRLSTWRPDGVRVNLQHLRAEEASLSGDAVRVA